MRIFSLLFGLFLAVAGLALFWGTAVYFIALSQARLRDVGLSYLLLGILGGVLMVLITWGALFTGTKRIGKALRP